MRPAGALTRADLAAAKARLGAFDVVVILEQFEEHEPQLARVLRWEQTALPWSLSSDTTAAPRVRAPPSPPVFSREQLDELEVANALDRELYEHAVELAAARTQAARVRGAAEDPQLVEEDAELDEDAEQPHHGHAHTRYF